MEHMGFWDSNAVDRCCQGKDDAGNELHDERQTRGAVDDENQANLVGTKNILNAESTPTFGLLTWQVGAIAYSTSFVQE